MWHLLAIAYRDKSLALLSATDAAKEMKTARSRKLQYRFKIAALLSWGSIVAARVPRLGNHLENI